MIIAISYNKGGIGKTTTTINVGIALAKRGYKTLLVDLDPQASLTGMFKFAPLEYDITQSFLQGVKLPVLPTELENVFVVPSSIALTGIDEVLATNRNKHFLLSSLLKPYQKKFDYILLDCPPNFSVTTFNALNCADKVIIPLIAEILPFKGLVTITDLIALIRKKSNKQLQLGGIVITRFNSRKINTEVEKQLRNVFGDLVFKTKIRENISLAEFPLTTSNIYDYNPNCNGAKDYESLTNEIIAKMK